MSHCRRHNPSYWRWKDEETTMLPNKLFVLLCFKEVIPWWFISTLRQNHESHFFLLKGSKNLYESKWITYSYFDITLETISHNISQLKPDLKSYQWIKNIFSYLRIRLEVLQMFDHQRLGWLQGHQNRNGLSCRIRSLLQRICTRKRWRCIRWRIWQRLYD